MAGVIVLDAGVLIGLLDSTDSHHTWARSLLTQTLDSDWAMSALTMAEVMVHPARAGKLDAFETGVAGLNIQVHELPPESAHELAKLRAQSGLKMPDVIVLQLAKKLGGEVATTDTSLAQCAANHGIRVHRRGQSSG